MKGGTRVHFQDFFKSTIFLSLHNYALLNVVVVYHLKYKWNTFEGNVINCEKVQGMSTLLHAAGILKHINAQLNTANLDVTFPLFTYIQFSNPESSLYDTVNKYIFLLCSIIFTNFTQCWNCVKLCYFYFDGEHGFWCCWITRINTKWVEKYLNDLLFLSSCNHLIG